MTFARLPHPHPHAAARDDGGALALVRRTIRGSGRPVEHGAPAGTGSPQLGHDFSRVRIHTDQHASESARAIGATAYTVGRHVVVGRGAGNAGPADRERVLAHELAHAAATGFAEIPPSAPLKLSDPHGAHERHAAWAALSPAAIGNMPGRGNMPPAPAHVIYRQPAPSPTPVRPPISLAPTGPPPGTGLRNPDITERVAIAAAEQRRLVVLEQALAREGAAIAAATAGTGAALAEFRLAFGRLNLFASLLAPGTPRREERIALVRTAFQLLRRNHDFVVPPMVVDEAVRADPRGTEYANAGLFDRRDPRRPMIIAPVFFGARPECQSFVLMHEIFHLDGVLGHGAGDKDWSPEWAIGHPSRLADFAWVLATGAVPSCDEKSVLEPFPTSPQGVVA